MHPSVLKAEALLSELCEIYEQALRFGEDSLGAEAKIQEELAEKRRRLLLKSEAILEQYNQLQLDALTLDPASKAFWAESLRRAKDYKPRFEEQQWRIDQNVSRHEKKMNQELSGNSTKLRAARAYHGQGFQARWH
jgi:hypothetical protein